VLNATLVPTRRLYRLTLAGQALFYGLAFLGWRSRDTPAGRTPLLYYPFYFCTVNAAAIVGCFRLLSGRQTVLWKRTRP
jgi:hypothetical protein